MPALVLDPSRSRVRIRTFAEGLLARLAHDLELVATGLRGTAAERGPGAGSAEVRMPLREVAVAGVLKDGRVDARGLSESDRADCLEKMRRDVFHAGADAEVRVEATLADGRAELRVVPPAGAAVTTSIRPEIAAEDGGALRVTGSLVVSLAAIGSSTVKGPMNAFRVKDKVEVEFDVVFAPPPTTEPAQPA